MTLHPKCFSTHLLGTKTFSDVTTVAAPHPKNLSLLFNRATSSPATSCGTLGLCQPRPAAWALSPVPAACLPHPELIVWLGAPSCPEMEPAAFTHQLKPPDPIPSQWIPVSALPHPCGPAPQLVCCLLMATSATLQLTVDIWNGKWRC